MWKYAEGGEDVRSDRALLYGGEAEPTANEHAALQNTTLCRANGPHHDIYTEKSHREVMQVLWILFFLCDKEGARYAVITMNATALQNCCQYMQTFPVPTYPKPNS
jgi:hypothetical protein